MHELSIGQAIIVGDLKLILEKGPEYVTTPLLTVLLYVSSFASSHVLGCSADGTARRTMAGMSLARILTCKYEFTVCQLVVLVSFVGHF